MKTDLLGVLFHLLSQLHGAEILGKINNNFSEIRGFGNWDYGRLLLFILFILDIIVIFYKDVLVL